MSKLTLANVVLALCSTLIYWPILSLAETRFAIFCTATKTDDCIGVARDGTLLDLEGSMTIPGRATIQVFRNGVVALHEGRRYCGVSDRRISRSYLTCGSQGWQIYSPGFTNTNDPWNFTDPFK
jgi:hypothetical protein